VGQLLRLAGGVSGQGTFVKTGAGTLYLPHADGYYGSTNIDQGYLEVANNNALGNQFNEWATTVASGATLMIDTGISARAWDVVLNGSGANSDGALEVTGGSSSLQAPIRLASNTSIGGAWGTLTLKGAISGPGSLTFGGVADTLVLAGKSTYSGSTEVQYGGTLDVTGSITSAVTVDNGAQLTGTGTVGNLTFLYGAQYDVVLDYTGSTEIHSTGTVNISAGAWLYLGFSAADNFTPNLNQQFQIIADGGQTPTGFFYNAAQTIQLGNYGFNVSYTGGMTLTCTSV
jgi:autotransporter-associated beta strand protein